MPRCQWCIGDPLYEKYHDEEWGRPLHEDRKLFELLVLEGAQAGLSWITILRKRENYREAFDQFDYTKIAAYEEKKIEELLQNTGIIRNRRKITSAIQNAQCFIRIREEFGSFDRYLWGFVDDTPIVHHHPNLESIPASTELSDRISKDMKKRGFSFVGTTILYSFLQSAGVVNDHTADCPLSGRVL